MAKSKPLAVQSLVQEARSIAEQWHCGQVRKYTEYPYVTHCERVASLTAMACPRKSVVSAAWLHDVLEDTECPVQEIARRCGGKTLGLVLQVTDVSRPEDGNRAQRKALDREHLARASPEAQTIKVADIIDNTMSIGFWDPNFARVYLQEIREVLGLLREIPESLEKVARETWRMAELHLLDHAVVGKGSWPD